MTWTRAASVVLLVVMTSLPLSGAVCALLCERAPLDGSTGSRLVPLETAPATSHHQHSQHPHHQGPATVEPSAPMAHHAVVDAVRVSARDCAGHDPAAWVAAQAVADRTGRDTLTTLPDVSLATVSPVAPLRPNVLGVHPDTRPRAGAGPPATLLVLRV